MATDLVEKINIKASHEMDLVAANRTFVDIKKRCRFERVVGLPFETLFFDNEPLLEIYPVEMEQERKDDRFVVRLTQKVSRPITYHDNLK